MGRCCLDVSTLPYMTWTSPNLRLSGGACLFTRTSTIFCCSLPLGSTVVPDLCLNLLLGLDSAYLPPPSEQHEVV